MAMTDPDVTDKPLKRFIKTSESMDLEQPAYTFGTAPTFAVNQFSGPQAKPLEYNDENVIDRVTSPLQPRPDVEQWPRTLVNDEVMLANISRAESRVGDLEPPGSRTVQNRTRPPSIAHSQSKQPLRPASRPASRSNSQVSPSSNISRRRHPVHKKNHGGFSKGQRHDLLEGFRALCVENEHKEELQKTIVEQGAALAAAADRIRLGKIQLKQQSSKCITLTEELSALDAKNSELTLLHKKTCQELAAIEEEKQKADAEVSELQAQLHGVDERLEKLQARSRQYRTHYNAAIEEFQVLSNTSKALVKKAIEECKNLKDESSKEQHEALERGEMARSNLLKAIEDAKESRKIQEMEVEVKLREVEKQLDQEVQHNANLTQQLENERQNRCTLGEIRSHSERIIGMLQDSSKSREESSAVREILDKLEEVKGDIPRLDEMLFKHDDINNQLELLSSRMLQESNSRSSSMADYNSSAATALGSIEQAIRSELAAMRNGHSMREAEMRQDLIKMAKETSESTTRRQICQVEKAALEVNNKDKDGEIHLLQLQLEEARVEISTQKMTAEPKANETRELIRQKDIRVAELGNEHERQEYRYREKTQDLTIQLQQAKDDQQRLRPLVFDTANTGTQTDTSSQSNVRDVEDKLAIITKSRDSTIRKLEKAQADLAQLTSTESVGMVSKLRNDLSVAEQRIANLTSKIQCSLVRNDHSTLQEVAHALNQTEQTVAQLNAVQAYLNELVVYAADITEMDELLRTLAEVQLVLHATHEQCRAETEFLGVFHLNSGSPDKDRAVKFLGSSMESPSTIPAIQYNEPSSMEGISDEGRAKPTNGSVSDKQIVLRTPSRDGVAINAAYLSHEQEQMRRRATKPRKSILRRKEKPRGLEISGPAALEDPALTQSESITAQISLGHRSYSRPVTSKQNEVDNERHMRKQTMIQSIKFDLLPPPVTGSLVAFGNTVVGGETTVQHGSELLTTFESNHISPHRPKRCRSADDHTGGQHHDAIKAGPKRVLRTYASRQSRTTSAQTEQSTSESEQPLTGSNGL